MGGGFAREDPCGLSGGPHHSGENPRDHNIRPIQAVIDGAQRSAPKPQGRNQECYMYRGPGKLHQRIVRKSGFLRAKIRDFLVRKVAFLDSKLADPVLQSGFLRPDFEKPDKKRLIQGAQGPNLTDHTTGKGQGTTKCQHIVYYAVENGPNEWLFEAEIRDFCGQSFGGASRGLCIDETLPGYTGEKFQNKK
ncbi:hypothetical protein DFH07DRAFT_1008061 [Mycena maculata]|uniref:Uncharacterized protein n=1 Tax=Mycena maculata TaxID=230809 RepID=A0AAD7NNN6_9AGAR|nr:hypothetical protein DFH07DRAFT_1008061 [Mycena maculata]